MIMIEKIKNTKIEYQKFSNIRIKLAGLMLFIAFISIAFMANDIGKAWHWVIVVFWTLVPPVWFFLEYYAIDNENITQPTDDVSKKDFLEKTKTYSAAASKIWAAVLAAVLFLFKSS